MIRGVVKMKRDEIHIRDPFVLVDNGSYYLLGTTGDDPWGKASDLTLYSSTDLQEFKRECTLVTDGSLDSYTNIWAPELHKYKGKYYLIFSAFREDVGRGSFIYFSESLFAGFTALTGEYITPRDWECLDATLFVYQNKPYLCFSDEWVDTVTGDGDGSLFICELSDDLTHRASKPRKIISGKYNGITGESRNGDIVGYIAEGPYLYEENGNIVLLWSTYTETGYTVVKSVSRSGIYGEYVFEKIVFRKDGGHCMCFTDLTGKRYLTFHQPNRTPDERMKLFLFEG